MDSLLACLLELLREFNLKSLPLIIGGGYGLFLKQIEFDQDAIPLIKPQFWPDARSTNDLDVFLAVEILLNADDCKCVKNILDKLGYEVATTSTGQIWQFNLPSIQSPNGFPMRIDLLAGAVSPDPRLKIKEKSHIKRIRNVKLSGQDKFHARGTDEALELEASAKALRVRGNLRAGDYYEGDIRIPSSFTYLLMKLIAFNDQKNSERGKRHALDVYRVVAMMTSHDYEECQSLIERSNLDVLQKAQHIVKELFASSQSIGIQAIVSTPNFPYDREAMASFINTLEELFPSA